MLHFGQILNLAMDSCYFPSEIYRQKLQQSVADGELSQEDVSALLRLRVMLCIAQKTVEAAHADICGSLFEKVTCSLIVYIACIRFWFLW